ncbi:hypothetical protein KQX64_17805 [Rhodopseudomonas palustris]|nr:hypothetical protein KQX64_17805 [Rhodopseudomonas palustris]
MKQPLVGLYSPRAQSGKSTTARHLAAQRGGVTMSFADPMRAAIMPIVAPFMPGGEAEVWEWLGDHRKDTAIVPVLGVTLRHLLQTLGTSWGRELIHPDLWTEIAKATSRRHRKDRLTIIDDVRFENEYALVRKEGGLLVKIVRPDAPVSGNFWHKSEARLEGLPFDAVITNTGDVTELLAGIDAVANEYWGEV